MSDELATAGCRCGCGQSTPIATETYRRYGYVKGHPKPFIRGHGNRLRRSTLEDFWENSEAEPNSGCWLWTLSRNPAGHGRVTHHERRGLAHRLSWTLTFGPIPYGLCVLHRCDNPPCINPAHLFLGTNLDNTADMISKGRFRPGKVQVFGERNGSAKLTASQVADIRLQHGAGISIAAICRALGLSRNCIERVVHRRTWTTVA